MEYIFTLQQPCHNATITKKYYKGLGLMIVYPWNLAHVKRQPWRKIFLIKDFNFFSSCEVISNVFKTFFGTFCYNNDEHCGICKL